MNTSLDFQNCWINGRTLLTALKVAPVKHFLPPFQATDRVSVNPYLQADLLVSKSSPFPFCTGSGVMATVLDVGSVDSQIYDFGLFQCTPSAFESSLFWIQEEDPTTKGVEILGRKVLDGDWAQSYDFSREVCEWGRGGRVWGKLKRYYTPAVLQEKLQVWFSNVAAPNGGRNAIDGGLEIKGLGVSFASKHLRLLNPDHYAVLDDVLSVGLGYALNSAGYALFMHELRRFKKANTFSYSLAQIESAIFGLVRQSVRGKPLTST